MRRFPGTTLRALSALGLSAGLLAVPGAAPAGAAPWQASLQAYQQAAHAKTTADRFLLAQAPRLSVAAAGPPTPIAAAEDQPGPAPTSTPASTSPSTKAATLKPGRDDDVVAEVRLRSGGGLVAVSWGGSAQPTAGTDLMFRTTDGSAWSTWRHLTPDGQVDSQAVRPTRSGTDPFWVPAAVRIQVRAAKARLADLTSADLTVVHPSTSPGTAATPPVASASANPTIISRAQWGADESLRGGCTPDIADTTKAAVVHHTAGSNNYGPGDSAAMVRSILYYHTQVLGWCDIGYNALVDRYGQTFEGRIGGIKYSVIGAHALGFNDRTFGVSILGDYEQVTPPQAAFTAVQNIIAMRLHDYYVDPMQTTVLTSASSDSRYPAGTSVRLPVITGHRDTYYTACPGINVWALLPNIRQATQRAAYYGDSAIFQRWLRDGAESTYGLVATGESRVPVGYRTTFTGYRSIYARPGGTSQLGSGIDDYYWQRGGIYSWGWPADEQVVPYGTRVDFSNNYAVFWSPGRGSQVTNGLILDYWNAVGGSGSRLGYPWTDMTTAASSGYVQQFSGGTAWYQGAAGGHGTYGAIDAAYIRMGGASSRLGYPVAEEVRSTQQVSQRFQYGTITVPTGGAPVVTSS